MQWVIIGNGTIFYNFIQNKNSKQNDNLGRKCIKLWSVVKWNNISLLKDEKHGFKTVVLVYSSWYIVIF